MHNLARPIAIALLAAVAVPAFANTESPTPQRVEITAARDAAVAARAVLALRGEDTVYELSNGRHMVVTAYGSHVEMRYGRRGAQQMRHDGRGNFVSRDGKLSLQFEIDRDGEARLVRLSGPASWF